MPWRWAETDINLLLQQTKGLKVTQQYIKKQQQLSAVGPEGKSILAEAQMELLGKVVDDVLAQLGPVEPGKLPEPTSVCSGDFCLLPVICPVLSCTHHKVKVRSR